MPNALAPTQRHRAFCRRDLIAVLVLAAVAFAVGALWLRGSAKSGRRHRCEDQLRLIGIEMANYSSDFDDRIMGLSWRAGQTKPLGSELEAGDTDLQAVANQVVDFLHSRYDPQNIEPIGGWLPNVSYSYLPLGDYVATIFPIFLVVCPEDAPRQAFLPKPSKIQTDTHKGGDFDPAVYPDAPTNADKRWPYSSSYQLVPAAYTGDQSDGVHPVIAQGSTDAEYLVPRDQPFGPRVRTFSDVQNPSRKVAMFDSHDRHFSSRQRIYADPKARQPLLFFDDSVHVRRTADANPGFQPNDPGNAAPTVFSYNPQGWAARWQPPPLNAGGDTNLKGYYRWTRAGLRGIDFDSNEPAADPAPPLGTGDWFTRAEP